MNLFTHPYCLQNVVGPLKRTYCWMLARSDVVVDGTGMTTLVGDHTSVVEMRLAHVDCMHTP